MGRVLHVLITIGVDDLTEALTSAGSTRRTLWARDYAVAASSTWLRRGR